MENSANNSIDSNLPLAPKGWAVLGLVGPSFVWCAEYIGSGEIILATRTGAILGYSILWAVVVGIFLKYWIGMSGARYTVCTGEGMIDMFSRIPGPRNWVVWIVLIAQFISATIAIGSIASAAGIFINSFIPVTPFISGWIVTVFCVSVVWSGVFDHLKIVMSIMVFVIIAGVLYVAVTVFPGISVIANNFFSDIPGVPEWAITKANVDPNPWREILPLLGWGAGGFASQVWYSYWVLGAGYGASKDKKYGEPADVKELKAISISGALKIKGWLKVVYTDATIAMVIGIVVTAGFLIAGAGVLNPLELAPQGEEVALTLAGIFSSKWGAFGGFIFLFSASVALISTQIGQLAGWPRLLADSFRICFPKFQKKYSWKIQFRGFLIFFLIANFIIVLMFGRNPLIIVQFSAILDGLLLTPLQAIWILIGLYVVMPKLYKPETAELLKPHWIFAVGLTIAFIVFGYFCVFQIPFII